jgi:hypothetical protein
MKQEKNEEIKEDYGRVGKEILDIIKKSKENINQNII